MTVVGCTGLLSPVCQGVSGIGSGVAGASAGAVLGAVTSWVVQGAGWLLNQIGGAVSSSTTVDLGAGWFTGHYQVMAGLGAVVVLPMLLVATVQAVYRQSAAVLVRVVAVQLPLAMVLTGVAVQLVQLSLAATDALGATVSSGVGTDVQQALQGVAAQLVAQAGGGPDSAPAFVVMLGGLLVAFGAFVLWLELLVRAAAVYVAVLFLPMALASLVWPAVSHWCRRLVETLAALVLAKFVIVAILSLAAAALASGTGSGFSSVLGGGALLLLAAFSPFALLRLVPVVEAGAVHQLEGARHRATHAVASAPRSAVHHALRAGLAEPLATGKPGTGTAQDWGAPGGGEAGPAGGGAPGPDGGGGGQATDPGGAAGSGGRAGGRRRAGRGRGTGDTGRTGDAGGEHPGLPGIPPWRGSPPVLDGSGSTLPAPPPGGDPDDPYGRGPLPVRAAPEPEPPPAPEPEPEPAAPGATPAGSPGPAAAGPPGEPPRLTAMTFRHDQYGPVITGWDRAGAAARRGADRAGPDPAAGPDGGGGGAGGPGGA